MKSSIRISPGWVGSIRSVSLIVDEFDIFRTSISPDEAETPLRVHTNAVLPARAADQALQSVPWRDREVLDILRRMEQFKLPSRCPLLCPVNALDVLLMPNAFSNLAAERSDHSPS